MNNAYDIDKVAKNTLAYLIARYPIPRPHRSWATKVRKPTIKWRPLSPNLYGYCEWSNNGYLMILNSSLPFTEEELVETIAHEYRHMLQSRALYKWHKRRLHIVYWKHPLEIDARAFSYAILYLLGYNGPLTTVATEG